MASEKQSKASAALEAAAVAYAVADKAHREAEKPFAGVLGSALTPEYEERVTPLRRAKDTAEFAVARAALVFGRSKMKRTER